MSKEISLTDIESTCAVITFLRILVTFSGAHVHHLMSIMNLNAEPSQYHTTRSVRDPPTHWCKLFISIHRYIYTYIYIYIYIL